MKLLKILPVFLSLFLNANILMAGEEVDAPNLFIWDFGFTPNFLDSGDIVFNAAKLCNSPELKLNLPVLKRLPELILKTLDGMKDGLKIKFDKSLIEEILKKYPVDNDVKKMINIFDSFRGDGEMVYVLLPEVHNNLPETICNQECKERHMTINAIRTYFTAKLTMSAIKKVKVANHREGIIGEQWNVENVKLVGELPKGARH